MKDATIISLFEKQEETLKEIIQLNGSAVRAKMESEVDRLDEADKRRNCTVNTLRLETTFWRWTQRNYRLVVPIVLLLLLLLIKGADRINVKRTFENQTGVIFDSGSDVAERGPIE